VSNQKSPGQPTRAEQKLQVEIRNSPELPTRSVRLLEEARAAPIPAKTPSQVLEEATCGTNRRDVFEEKRLSILLEKRNQWLSERIHELKGPRKGPNKATVDQYKQKRIEEVQNERISPYTKKVVSSKSTPKIPWEKPQKKKPEERSTGLSKKGKARSEKEIKNPGKSVRRVNPGLLAIEAGPSTVEAPTESDCPPTPGRDIEELQEGYEVSKRSKFADFEKEDSNDDWFWE